MPSPNCYTLLVIVDGRHITRQEMVVSRTRLAIPLVELWCSDYIEMCAGEREMRKRRSLQKMKLHTKLALLWCN